MEVMGLLFGIFLLVFVWWFFIASGEERTEIKQELNELEEVVEEKVKQVKLAIPTASQLNKMTKAKLKELCDELGVDVDTKQTKAKIVEELEVLRKKFD